MSTNPVYADVQKLEAGERVEVYELDMRQITGNPGDILRFHGYTKLGPVYWQAQEYSPWPIHAEGFERTTDQQPTPTLAVGNLDGSITALCLAWQDLVGARIVRHKTFGKYLDSKNYDVQNSIVANATPFGTPDGVKKSFQLVDDQGRAVTNPTVTAMHQTDWQGRQLLYPTARTNAMINSQCDHGFVARGSSTPPIIADYVTFDGASCTAVTFDATMTGVGYGNCRAESPISYASVPAGQLYGWSMYIGLSRALTGSESIYVFFTGSAGAPGLNLTASSCAPFVGKRVLTTGLTTINPNGIGPDYPVVYLTHVVSSPVTVYLSDGMVFIGAAAVPFGPYIPTTTAPVTVTDYAVDSSGNVTLGQSPAVGATLDWDGSGTSVTPGVNPTANPLAEFPPDIWFIERKASETNTTVSFELSNALNFMGQQLPARQIIANVCTWQYRSTECGYTGPAVADINDKPTTDPAKDACGKRLSSCKLRFPNQPLPFGAFPAADVSRT